MNELLPPPELSPPPHEEERAHADLRETRQDEDASRHDTKMTEERDSEGSRQRLEVRVVLRGALGQRQVY